MTNGDTRGEKIVPPPESVWFGLHRRSNDGRWVRCERAEWGEQSKWWRVGEADPIAIASSFGVGVYRVMWRGEHKNKNKGTSRPFEIIERPEASQVAQPTQMSGAADQLLPTDPSDPLRQFSGIYMIVRRDLDLAHERMVKMFELMSERDRESAKLNMHHMALFYQTMNAGQLQLSQQIAAAKEDRAELAQKPLVLQLEALNTRIAELAEASDDDEDDDDELGGAMARIGEDPSDAEKVFRGVATLMQNASAFANTGLGRAFAKKLFGVDAPPVPTVPIDEAAE